MSANAQQNAQPKRRGRQPGSPKVSGSGRVKGKEPKTTRNMREVCREVLGLDNLAIRKRLQAWLETGNGRNPLDSATFRHVLTMGYGQPKHAMETGGVERLSLVFIGRNGRPGEHDPMALQEREFLEAQAARDRLELEAHKAEDAELVPKGDMTKGDSVAPEGSRRHGPRGPAMSKFLSPYRSPHSQKFADRPVTKPPLSEAAEASAQVRAARAVTHIEQPAVKVRRAKKAARVNNGSSVTNKDRQAKWRAGHQEKSKQAARDGMLALRARRRGKAS